MIEVKYVKLQLNRGVWTNNYSIWSSDKCLILDPNNWYQSQ